MMGIPCPFSSGSSNSQVSPFLSMIYSFSTVAVRAKFVFSRTSAYLYSFLSAPFYQMKVVYHSRSWNRLKLRLPLRARHTYHTILFTTLARPPCITLLGFNEWPSERCFLTNLDFLYFAPLTCFQDPLTSCVLDNLLSKWTSWNFWP
jgi:hypothetical protein